MQTNSQTYEKHNSFQELYITQGRTSVQEQTQRALTTLKNIHGICPVKWTKVLKQVFKDLEEPLSSTESFKITPFVADEMNLLSDKELPRYLFHRYRYEVFPNSYLLDDYPPYLQIEPSSICNYRCVFCYQTDESFSEKKSTHMGSMSIDLYKKIVDEAEGNIEFLSLASRGEPMICRDFKTMMEYSIGKFLYLKVNTNASLMTENLCHALLCGGTRTIVFSADAAEEPLYSKLRVNGKLDRVIKNIERFQKIRETQYPQTQLITRVSGVMFDHEKQNMESMRRLWGGLVDQISFVKYNPWENIYDTKPNDIKTPCTELWRRMFVWHDGTVNPCDSDYRSNLQVGNIIGSSIDKLWANKSYQRLRNAHHHGSRSQMEPCCRCTVV